VPWSPVKKALKEPEHPAGGYTDVHRDWAVSSATQGSCQAELVGSLHFSVIFKPE